MKFIITLLTLISFNASADFTIGFPGGFDFPDFGEYEQSLEIFKETVETLNESTEVKKAVLRVEAGHLSACIAQPEKASRGLVWFKLPYICEGAKDFTLIVKARLKKDQVIVKSYKITLK